MAQLNSRMKRMFTGDRPAYALIFSAGCLWGMIGIFVNQLNACGASPAFLSFLRVSLACVMLAGMTAFRCGIRSLLVPWRTLLICALLGLVCQGFFNLFYSMAILRAGVMVSAVLLYLAPLFTAVASRLLFKEEIGSRKRLALLVNILGCALAATGGNLSLAGVSAVGLLFGVGAGFCYSMNAVIGKIAGERTNVFVINTYSYLFAALFLLLFTHPLRDAPAISPKLLTWGVLYALVPTAIAYLIYFTGVQRIAESSRVPVVASVETVVAAIVGVVLYGESMGGFHLLGILLVLSSILMMSASPSKSS